MKGNQMITFPLDDYRWSIALKTLALLILQPLNLYTTDTNYS